MLYAYIQLGTVVFIERRLSSLAYTDGLAPLVQSGLYHSALIPFFKSVPESIENDIREGWMYIEGEGFSEPTAFAINPETGQLYLPTQISASDFYNFMLEASKITTIIPPTPVTLNDHKASKIAASKSLLAAYLEVHPLISSAHGGSVNSYTVTSDKQAQLTSVILMASEAAASGSQYDLTWNATGEPCTVWALAELKQLAFEINAYVKPLVTEQQYISLESALLFLKHVFMRGSMT